jgi:hypothetical protein
VQETTKEIDVAATQGRGQGLSLGPLQGRDSKGRMRRDDHVNNCTWYFGILQGFWERKGSILKKTNRERRVGVRDERPQLVNMSARAVSLAIRMWLTRMEWRSEDSSGSRNCILHLQCPIL